MPPEARCATVTRVRASSTSASAASGGHASTASTRLSTMTFAHSANNAYLFGKCRYSAGALIPTAAAISSMEAPW